ncbi:MAG: AmmeMemoRadiSam system protein B [bacterium]|nr:AmmeMemoRadiSam system protein B [bacterium]
MKIFWWKITAAVLISTAIFVAFIILREKQTIPADSFVTISDSAPVLIAKERDVIATKPEFPYNEAAPITEEDLNNYYANADTVPDIGPVRGGIISHHDIAGNIPAGFFKYLAKQNPSVVVLVGPNHYNKGGAAAITTLRDWQTIGGFLKTDTKSIKKLAALGFVKVDEHVIDGDHSISNIVPYIKKSLPNTKIIPILLMGKTKNDRLDKLAEAILKFLPRDAVIVGSVDFSHYQMLPVANFHDETTATAITNFDYDRLRYLDSDSASGIYTVLKMLSGLGAEKVAWSYFENSANILRNPALRESVSYYVPYFVDGKIEKKPSASILNFGDMMLDRSVAKAIDKNGPGYLLDDLAGGEGRFFAGVDAVGANLEGPFANVRRDTSKSIAFRFDPSLIAELKKYNFTTLNCANNHTYDMGADGFSESLANLNKAGIDCYGAQYSVGEKSVLYKTVGNFNVAFVGLNDTNTRLDMDDVSKIIKEAKTKADKVVVNIHWGEEYKNISNTRQRAVAHAMIDAGADAIIGHHPHVVEEMEIYNNRPIFYSLGNFIFDQYFSKETQEGLSVGLVFYNDKISIYVFPLKSVKSQPLQMGYNDGLNYLKNWQKSARGLPEEFVNYHLDILQN